MVGGLRRRERHSAVEEIVRWASPVVYMRRRVTEDLELSGVKLAAGDKVTMWYCSANRDEVKFDDPCLFDVTRDPNPHVEVRRRWRTLLPRRESGAP